MENIYKQLSGVDIEEQKRIWDERGKGYYGEYLLFCHLYHRLPGNYKFLMNLEIPAENEKTTEIDLLLIHETGIYIFEVKHYNGIIYGSDDDAMWTQFFKTTSNNAFKNPIAQNGYHMRNLRNLLPEINIASAVVFTHENCELRVRNNNEYIDVCTLRNVDKVLSRRFDKMRETGAEKLTVEQIDSIFEQLSQYAPLQNPVVIDGETAPLEAWVSPIMEHLKNLKEDATSLNQRLKQRQKDLKTQKISNLVLTIGLAVVCCFILILSIDGIKKGYSSKLEDVKEDYNTKLEAAQNDYNSKISEFAQKFLYVDEIDNPFIGSLDSNIDVSDVLIEEEGENVVSFTAKLTLKTDLYKVRINADSKYIVRTTSGQVFQYDMFNEGFRYYESSNTLTPNYNVSGTLKPALFYGIANPSNIAFVKITGIDLLKNEISERVIEKDLELGLYFK